MKIHMEIRLDKQMLSYINVFEEMVEQYPEMMECCLTTGSFACSEKKQKLQISICMIDAMQL